jgi:hypothetical protein
MTGKGKGGAFFSTTPARAIFKPAGLAVFISLFLCLIHLLF